jgi:hypothetical protein
MLILSLRCELDADFGGIIYFHDITQDRGETDYSRTWPAANLTKPNSGTVQNLLLATSKWDRVSSPGHTKDYETKQEKLKKAAWAKPLRMGARVAQFENTKESAMNVLSKLLDERKLLKIVSLHQDLKRIRVLQAPRRRSFFPQLKALSGLFSKVPFALTDFAESQI